MELLSGGLMGLLAIAAAGAVAYWGPLRDRSRRTLKDLKLDQPEQVWSSIRSAASTRLGSGLWDRFSAGMSEDDVRRALLGRVGTCRLGGEHGLQADPVRVENHLAVPTFWFRLDRLERVVLYFPMAPNDPSLPASGQAARLREHALVLARRVTQMLDARYGRPGRREDVGPAAAGASAGSSDTASRSRAPDDVAAHAGSGFDDTLNTWRTDGKVVELRIGPLPEAVGDAAAREALSITYLRDGASAL